LQSLEKPQVKEIRATNPVIETAATVESASVSQPSQPAQPNEQVELVKETSKKYIEYVKEFGMKPSLIFRNPENQFTNALITIAIILLLASYTIFSAIKSVYNSAMGGFGIDFADLFETQTPKLPFFSIFSNAFLLFLLLLAVSVGVIFVVLKISKQQVNFKSLVGVYGTLLLPVIGVVFLSFLFVLINKVALGMALLFLGFAMAVYLYPLRIAFHNFIGELKIDVIHRGLMYFGGFSIVLYIVLTEYVISKVKPFVDQFNYFF